MRRGDLISYGTMPHWQLRACLGILLRKLQPDTDDDLGASNWDGEPAWWIQYMDDEGPTWTYEVDLTLVTKGD